MSDDISQGWHCESGSEQHHLYTDQVFAPRLLSSPRKWDGTSLAMTKIIPIAKLDEFVSKQEVAFTAINSK